QNGRRAGRPRDLTEHGRMTAVELEETCAVEPRVAQDLGGRLGAPSHLRRVVPVVADGGDGDQPRELIRDALAVVVDVRAQVVHGAGAYRGLRVETLDRPGVAVARVAEPIVQTE